MKMIMQTCHSTNVHNKIACKTLRKSTYSLPSETCDKTINNSHLPKHVPNCNNRMIQHFMGCTIDGGNNSMPIVIALLYHNYCTALLGPTISAMATTPVKRTKIPIRTMRKRSTCSAE